MIAEVAFPLPLQRTFDYLVPAALEGRVGVGGRIRASFGPRRMEGVVVSLKPGAQSGRPLKPLDEAYPSMWGPDVVELAAWLSKKYCASLGECLGALLPKYVRPMKREAREKAPAPPSDFELGERFTLNPEQAHALGRLTALLDGRRFAAALVLGVPASGKTEIYLRLLEKVAEEGGQAMFMVPEIALTHPFFEEFRARMKVPVVSWHSKGSLAAKRKAWLELAKGRPAIVVGARSACLLPLPKLRLAVLDEEQDESYKQDEPAPHYHARDVALERAKRAGALVVLGSATPSVESYRRAAEGEWELLRLPRGAMQTVRPSVTILDRRKHPELLLCPELAEDLKRSQEEKEQAILIVNRRGFSSITLCKLCGWMAKCELCGVAMVLHRVGGKPWLICHHCEAKKAPPGFICPKCKKPGMEHSGAGTQKAEQEAQALLPESRVLRFDRDSMKADKEGASLYRKFKKLEADVMVGTKLISKGYHFPEVTLVGIVDADAMLHFPDFRGAEKTFQLLVQAAGRAGRAQKQGRVLLQTFHPDHYAIEAAVSGDYEAFAKKELEYRKELGYPPYSSLFRVLVSGEDEIKTARAADEAAQDLRMFAGSNVTEILGPAPAFYRQLRGKFRYHILLKAKQSAAVNSCLEALKNLKAPAGVVLKVIVDPHDLF